MPQRDDSPRLLTPPRLVALALAAAALAAGALIHQAAFRFFQEEARAELRDRAALYRLTLVAAIERHQHLPGLLADDPMVIAALYGVQRDALNTRLAGIADSSGVEAVYVMDTSGLTIAASNFDREPSFLGENYAFRPYFRNAMLGRPADFFGIGATTTRPGYFLADPVRNRDDAVIGVTVAKLDLSPLAAAWRETGERVFVANADGVIVLASDPSLAWRTLRPIQPVRRAEIEAERQFIGQPLDPLDWRMDGPGLAELGGAPALHVGLPLGRRGWTLHLLGERGQASERAWTVVIAVAVVAALMAALGFYLKSERTRRALVESQTQRRELEALNRELTQTRTELDRKSRLATLGRLAASVTHELGQPLSAMRNYLAAAEMSAEASGGNGPFGSQLTGQIGRILDRMEGITRQLRFFVKPKGEPHAPVDLVPVVRDVLALLDHDLRDGEVTLRLDLPDGPVTVPGNRLQLEQVLINLVRNAIDAMEDEPRREIAVSLAASGGAAVLTVADTGHGLRGQSVETLQEPFHTTRASGDGMGLGLAISGDIVHDHGGRLDAADAPGGGAVFTVTLPLEASP